MVRAVIFPQDRMAKIFIALPAFGRQNFTPTTSSLMGLARALLRDGHDFYFSTLSNSTIDELRNAMTTVWYDAVPDSEWMAQVDADMDFEPELITDMLKFGKPLMGCLYPKKTYPLDFVGRGVKGPARVIDGFMEMAGIGFGVTMIHRSCITMMLESGQARSDEKIDRHTAGDILKGYGSKRIIRAFDPLEDETGRLSDDMSFCRRYRNSGGEVWAATHHRITHVGQHGYTGRYADRWDKQQASDAAAA